MTSTQLWPTKSKKRGRPPTTDAKPTNPPKKRGRPKKASSNSPAKPKDTAPPENLFFPPNKPKRYGIKQSISAQEKRKSKEKNA